MNSAFSGELFSDGCLQYSTQNDGYATIRVYILYNAVDGRKKNELKYNKKRLIYGESNNFRSFITCFVINRLSSVPNKNHYNPWIIEYTGILQVFRLERFIYISQFSYTSVC